MYSSCTQGSSTRRRCSTSARRCSSPRRLAWIATPCIGVGKSSGLRWIWSSSWESCRTTSYSTSSTLVRAPKSPGISSGTSSNFLPCMRSRWPTLNGLRPSPANSCISRRSVPWCTRNTAMRPTKGSTTTLNTCASTWASGSGRERKSRVLPLSSVIWNSGGLPSVGFGARRARTSSSSCTPAPLRAETKHSGIRCPSRSARSKGSCNSSGRISPCSR
ncbi:hypothetical protein D9M68_575590 [compost metagenome]